MEARGEATVSFAEHNGTYAVSVSLSPPCKTTAEMLVSMLFDAASYEFFGDKDTTKIARSERYSTVIALATKETLWHNLAYWFTLSQKLHGYNTKVSLDQSPFATFIVNEVRSQLAGGSNA